MKKQITLLIILTYCSLITNLNAQVIDFENFDQIIQDPNDGEPWPIDNSYFAENYCLQFYEGEIGGNPARIGKVGEPAAGYSRNNAAVPFELANPDCGQNEITRIDMPNPGQNVGCYFLTTERVNRIPRPLVIDYSSDCKCFEFSGVIMDIDGNEAWEIAAFSDDESTTALASITISSGDEGTGDALATNFSIGPLQEPIEKIVIRHVGTSTGVGFAFDNFSFCSIEEEKLCGNVLKDSETLSYTCTAPNDYNYSFALENLSEDQTVTSVLIQNVSPGYTVQQMIPGIGLSDQPHWTLNNSLPFNMSPILPAGVSDPDHPFQIIISGSLVTEPTEVCFDIVYHSDGYECCRFEHCVTLEPTDVCESVASMLLETGENCCYQLVLEHSHCEDYFTGVVTTINTPDVVFEDYFVGDNWTATLSEDENEILWTPTVGFIPTGSLESIDFCVGGINSTTQLEPMINIQWLSADPQTGNDIVECTSEEILQCSGCMEFTIDEFIPCNEGGTYNIDFSVLNNEEEETATSLTLVAITPNMYFFQSAFTINIAPGETFDGSFILHDLNEETLPPGAVVTFKAILENEMGLCCHLDDLSFEIPDCKANVDCNCDSERTFQEDLTAGFTTSIDCGAKLITFTPKQLKDCDEVVWTMELPNGGDTNYFPATGTASVTFEAPVNGNYDVKMEVVRSNQNREACYTSMLYQELVAVQCEGVNSTTELAIEPDYQLYPNPATAEIFIKIANPGMYQLMILNQNGQLIAEQSIKNSSLKQVRLPIENLEAGLYFMKLSDEKGFSTELRFLKL